MIYFTSDLHFCDERLNLFGRENFTDSEEVDNLIIKNWNNTVSDDDTVYVLGDVSLTRDGLEKINLCKGRKYLIKGNYDEYGSAKYPVDDALLKNYFEQVYSFYYLRTEKRTFYLNHYPTRAQHDHVNLCGHIHGLWRVQRNMINVGVDANGYFPVSLDKIEFILNGILNHYDENVFAGELEANTKKIPAKVIKAPVFLSEYRQPVVFLAGPIQGTYDWHKEVIDGLKDTCGIVIASPKRADGLVQEGKFDYTEQVYWESYHLNKASKNGVIAFWLAKETEHMPERAYAQTTRFELSEWLTKQLYVDSIRIILGIEKGFSGERYIRERLVGRGISISDTIEDFVEEIIKEFDE